ATRHWLNEEEALIVRSNIIQDRIAIIEIACSREEDAAAANGKGSAGSDFHAHQIACAVAVEQLPARMGPPWLEAALQGDLKPTPRPREWLNQHLLASRCVRDVGEPVPVGRKRRRKLVRGSHRERVWRAIGLGTGVENVPLR